MRWIAGQTTPPRPRPIASVMAAAATSVVSGRIRIGELRRVRFVRAVMPPVVNRSPVQVGK